jgi:hypothetical protein
MKTQKSWISRRSFLKSSLVKATQTALALTLGQSTLGSWAKAQNTPALTPVKWDSTLELALTLTLERPSGGRYERPYVAVWLEDANGNAIRTLELWMKQGKGMRWLPELKRWNRAEQSRKTQDNRDLAATIASPTREAGKYNLVWDGKNDKDALVDQGTYYICVETAREHGPYQLIREAVVLGAKPLGKKLTGDKDVKEVSVDYRKRK